MNVTLTSEVEIYVGSDRFLGHRGPVELGSGTVDCGAVVEELLYPQCVLFVK